MQLFILLMLFSQDYSQRGFAQTQMTLYPQEAANDRAHVVGEVQLRHESFLKFRPNLHLAAAFDLRADTHHQTEREWRLDWRDRERKRPLLSLHRLSVQYYRSGLTIEAGKQFIRWGRTDIVNPTDRFAPRDYLTVVDNEFLGVEAVRGTYERGANTLDVVWSPRLTPSRTPLLSQRWFVAPPGTPALTVDRVIPEGAQTGLRWSHAGFVEFAAAFYSGFHHLPSYEPSASPSGFTIRETYAKQRMIGGDVGLPLALVSIKAEAAWFQSPDHRADNYWLYVIQLERQAGEWFIVGGYGGQAITEAGLQTGDFDPTRGMTRTILARAGYAIDPNRSVAFEAAVRENLDGFWSKTEYSQAFGQHWRITAAVSLIRGEPADFLGQYRRNSHVAVVAKYSF